MTKHDTRLALLTAQLRAYGGKIGRNVVDGHNVTSPTGEETRLASTHDWGGNPGKRYPQLISALRAAIDRARNPRGRFYTVVANPDDGEPAGMVGIVDSLHGEEIVAWTHESRVAAVIAGLADAELTRD